MTPNDLTLRKIALVLVGLEPADADRLLAQFPSAQAEQVRRAVESLGEISRDEQEAAILEFLESRARAERAAAAHPTAADAPLHDSAAVELDAGLARQFASAARADETSGRAPTSARTAGMSHHGRRPIARESERSAPATSSPGSAESSSESSSWQRICSLDAASLGKCLVRENPQTIAAVLASLPNTLAAQTLASLPEVHQPEVLRRLTHARPLGADLLEDIAAGLLAACTASSTDASRTDSSESAAAAILAAADLDQRRRWRHFVPELRRVERMMDDDEERSADGDAATIPIGRRRNSDPSTSPRAARSLGDASEAPARSSRVSARLRRTRESAAPVVPAPTAAAFTSLADLLELPETDLVLLLASSDPWAVALALAGAAPETAAQWMQRMPELDAREIQSQLTRLGPWRLADAAAAERQLLATANRLFPAGPAS